MGRKRLGRWAYIWDYRLKPPGTKVCKAYNPGPPIPNKFWALCSIRGGDPRAGSWVMDRKGGNGSSVPRRFLLIAGCTSLAAVSQVRAVEPVTATPASQLADGIWMVQGRAIPVSRSCNDRLVRLTNRQGRLSGVVAFARASVPIHNLTLLPDGSFSGATRSGLIGSRLARVYKITGRFSGDTVSVTLENDSCPPRHGVATRRAASG